MKSARRILALLMLIAWVLAIGHVALEHCAAMNGGCIVACHAHADGCHEGESEDGGHHHHLTVFTSSPLAKLLECKLAPSSVWCGRLLAEQWQELLRAAGAPRLAEVSWESPPDARVAGWLRACRTAHPVRGPSLPA